MNRNILKYIAIVAMTIDHIGFLFTTLNPIVALIFRMIGRITFPIMCFFIAEGFNYTKDKKKYALRLFVFALISQIPFTLVFNGTIFTWKLITYFNTIFTLLLSFLLLWVLEDDMKLVHKSILIVLITAFSFMCEYYIVGLIYTLFFYLLRNNKYKFLFLPILYMAGVSILILIDDLVGANLIYYIFMSIGLIFTLPLLCFYNNKGGNKHIIHKYFFYAYYPLHLLVLFLIVNLV